MREEHRATYINSQIVCAQIELHAMLAANKTREAAGEAQAYGEDAFMGLLSKFNIDHNSVIGFLNGY